MSKNNRANRDAKKRRKAKKSKNQRARKAPRKDVGGTIPSGYSTPLMKSFGFENPLSALSDDRRNEFATAVGQRADREFNQAVEELSRGILTHDPLELLATAAFYTLFSGEGHTEGPYTQAMVELLQSFCLQHPVERFGTEAILLPSLFRLLDLSKSCSKDYSLRRLSDFAGLEEEHRPLAMAVEEARMHTQMMRNWGYPQHMRRIVRELLAPLEADCETVIGIGPLRLLSLADALSGETCKRADAFRHAIGDAFRTKSLRKMVDEFCRLAETPEAAETIFEQMKDLPGPSEKKRLFLLSYFHQNLPEMFLFDIEQCQGLAEEPIDATSLTAVLDQLSYEFGDLLDENPEHLVMQSKIRSRPIIRADEGSYFIPIHGLLNSFFLEIVESIISGDKGLKNKYHKRRAVYLEASLEELVRDAFPGCPVETSTVWRDSESGKEYENDCFVVCGPLAVVLEAKSERVDDSAKRGADKTLAKHYGTLVSEPAEQAARLAQLLEEGNGVRRFTTKKGESFELDLSAIQRAVCVSVILDWLPAVSLSWQKLISCGFVSEGRRPAINVSLADLLVVLEVLESPARRIHYLWRRAEWETKVEYTGDEEDLLVYYLSEGLAIPPTPSDSEPVHMMLYGNSDELHRYYMAEWAGESPLPPPPRRILTPWWVSLVDRVESLDDARKWHIACVLLDLSFERQEDFERKFKAIVKSVRAKGNDSENGLFTYSDHTESVGAVVAFAYQDMSIEERNSRASDLASQARTAAGAKRIVVLGVDVGLPRDRPYDFLMYMDGAV